MATGDDATRARIGALLEGGLATEWTDRAYTSDAVNAVAAQLRGIRPADLEGKLVAAGFTLHPYESDGVSQACETCMYYLVHRKYCELPELALPVEPAWSCRLWRI